jgi:hypothetical protein
MNLQEIKDLFGVDLSQDNRNRLFVILKNIYVNQERLKGVIYKDIAEELKSSISTIILSCQRTDKFKTYFNYKNVEIAFKNKNQELFALEKQLYDNICKFKDNNVYIPTTTKRTRDRELVNYLDMIPHPKRRWHYTQIIQVLKKDNRNKLWDKPMPDFTFRDYQILNKLNM